ncbi:MAG: flagellar basal body-associated FliL family protein [Alphaproteobacteria bacterium]|nr:MAG: flagellar basal body-associated FliL family protein [Alphaproteobacteria bacterium]
MHIKRVILAVIAGFFIAGNAYASSSEEKSSEGSVEYVKLDPLILPIIDQDGVYQVLSLAVVIEVNGVNDADKIKAKAPRLKDAYIQDMYGILNENAALKGGVVQVRMIKKRLNQITKRIMGDDIETEVLLQVVQQRPI